MDADSVSKHYLKIDREITNFWISDVPSPIVQSFASRKYFSAGKSLVYPYPPNIWTPSVATSTAISDAYSFAIADSFRTSNPLFFKSPAL